jgi:predicted membrane-bound spermidine synthase
MKLTAYIIFILSGAAGLIYESIWARYLGLFVGHTAYSQVLVLTIFLGGMAIGAMIIGERSKTLRDPLRGYAFAELALAIIAIVFHGIYLRVTGFAYDTVFPALAGGVFLTAVKWGIAGALILPQAILLGMTFPLMAAGVLRRSSSAPGQTISLLYFSNSLGAAAGVLVAGFYLLKIAGLPGTLVLAGLLNLTAALVSYLLTRRFPLDEDHHEVAVVPQIPRSADSAPIQRLLPFLLAVSFGTALASFIYEISWLRMLALVLGSATHSFELMLSAFILGLALGAFWVRNRSDGWKQPLRALGIVQWVMGLTALATLPLYIASFGWIAELLGAFAKTGSGYAGFTLSRYVICLAVMLPSTFCAGITLPLITRTLLTSGTGERAIGAVYGINTLGSIAGVIIAGLIALPLIGLKALLVTGAVLDMGIGVWILFVAAGQSKMAVRLAYAAVTATVFVTGAAAITQRFDPTLLASGVFREGNIFEPGVVESVFHQDGRTATISVLRMPAEDLLTISTNGKPDASLYQTWFDVCSDSLPKVPLTGDASTQTLAALITLAHRPDARRAAVIGQGSGISSQILRASDALEEIVTVEIEPEMIRGSREFYPANRRVFDDPRSTIVIEDARTYFAATGEEFDLVFSEPSNPWVSGVSSLFTTEFYRHIRRYLADDGVFGQWMQLYEIDDAMVLSIVAALHENFRSYEIFLVDATDMLLVASEAEVMPQPDWSVASFPGLVDDLCNFVPLTPEALEGTRVSHRAALAPLLDGWGQPNSDFYPAVDLFAERARYLGRNASGFEQLPVERFDLTAPFFDRRVPLGSEMVVAVPAIEPVGARALSATLRALRDGAEPPQESLPLEFRGRIHRWEEWLSALDGDRTPSDWRLWTSRALDMEVEIGLATAGVADETLFRDIRAYMDRHDAPEAAREAMAFRRALATWDFQEMSRIADVMLPSFLEGDGWMLPEEVLVGGVTAKLRLGDIAGASSLWEELAPRVPRNDPYDLRLELLRSYLDVYEAGPGF